LLSLLIYIQKASANSILDFFIIPQKAKAEIVVIPPPAPKVTESFYRGVKLTEAQSAVVEEINTLSKQAGLNPETMKAIANAESGFRTVCNWKYTDEKGKYTACGVFQITRTTFRSFCSDDVALRFDNHENIMCAVKIAKESGLHHWDESGDWK
jgi:hypothetical protein